MGAWESVRAWCVYHYRRRMANRLAYGRKGVNVQLHNGSVFEPPGNISFGDDIYVGPEAYFWADGGIVIHDNVIFGPRVSIFTSTHKIDDVEFLPYGPVSEKAPVEIFSNVWIGAYCIILPGVRIGEGAVCGAGSVVSRHVPPLAIVGGNPAEVKRYRDPRQYLELKQAGRLFMRHKRDHEVQPRYVLREGRVETMRHAPVALEQRERLRLDDLDLQG